MTEAMRLYGRSVHSNLAAFWATRSETAHWNALGVFVVRALSAALLFVSQIALARWMGADDYGIYVAAWTCVLVLGGLSNLGLSVAMMRLVPQFHASGAYDELRGLLRGGRALAMGSAAVVAALGSCALLLVGAWHNTPTSTAQILALMCLPLYALTDVQDGLGRGQGWTYEAIAPPYLLRPLLLLLILGCAHAGGFSPDAASAMMAALLATAATAAVQTLMIERRIGQTVPRGKAQYAIRSWLHISLPLLGAAACEVIMQNTDVLTLSAFRSPDEIGIYYASAKTAGLALFVQYAIGTTYAGRIATASAMNDMNGVRALVGEAVRWTFFPTLLITLSILALGLPVLSQFGARFTDAYPLMFVLAVGVLARAAVGPSEVVLNMLGRQRACAASMGTAAIVCVVLNVILVPSWGIYGASVATATSIVTAAALNWYAARRLLGLNLFVAFNLGGAPRAAQVVH